MSMFFSKHVFKDVSTNCLSLRWDTQGQAIHRSILRANIETTSSALTGWHTIFRKNRIVLSSLQGNKLLSVFLRKI